MGETKMRFLKTSSRSLSGVKSWVIGILQSGNTLVVDSPRRAKPKRRVPGCARRCVTSAVAAIATPVAQTLFHFAKLQAYVPANEPPAPPRKNAVMYAVLTRLWASAERL